jgi:hypothetical protein
MNDQPIIELTIRAQKEEWHELVYCVFRKEDGRGKRWEIVSLNNFTSKPITVNEAAQWICDNCSKGEWIEAERIVGYLFNALNRNRIWDKFGDLGEIFQ